MSVEKRDGNRPMAACFKVDYTHELIYTGETDFFYREQFLVALGAHAERVWQHETSSAMIHIIEL